VLAEELFPTWLAGGDRGHPTDHIVSGQVDLVELIERERVTVIELPTAYWHEWVRELERHRPVSCRAASTGDHRRRARCCRPAVTMCAGTAYR
jgi:hypothetical protein